MAQQPTTPRPCACTTVRRASRSLARAFDTVMGDASLNVTQLAVLRALERHPGAPLTHIAEDLSMERTSLYRAVGTMADSGWLKLLDGRDARSRSAQLTPAGARVLREAAPYWDAVQSRIVERFGRRRWTALAADLGELMAIADEVQIEAKQDRSPSP